MEKGYELYSDTQIVVIATMESENRKTGNMVQIWILNEAQSPVEAVKSGQDIVVCLDCKHRGTGFKDRTCYVNVGQGPNSVWRAYIKGAYPRLRRPDYAIVFGGRKVRFGAYGDPVLIPLEIVRWIAFWADGHSGYTHQWMRYPAYREYLMASVDSVAEYGAAKALGWRTFRVRHGAEPLGEREIMCPASDEAGHKTTCEHCLLCSGADGVRKDIAIVAHGSGARNFVALTALTR